MKGRKGFIPTFLLSAVSGLLSFICHDLWCEGSPLKELFPSRYALAANNGKRVLLLLLIVSMCLAVVFGPLFLSRTPLFMMRLMLAFSLSFNRVSVRESSFDLVRWDLNSKGIFTVRSYYMKFLSLLSLPLWPPLGERFLQRLIWKSLIPFEVSLFFGGSIPWEYFDL